MAFRFAMRHESSSIKSLCCKAWRRSSTGVFCFIGFVAGLAGMVIAPSRRHTFRRGFRAPGKLANMPSDKWQAPSGLCEPILLDVGRVVAGRGLMQVRCMRFDAFTARCSWKSRQYHRSWQCLLSGRRMSGADRPSLHRFRQVLSCARSPLCELHRPRCRSNRLRL